MGTVVLIVIARVQVNIKMTAVGVVNTGGETVETEVA